MSQGADGLITCESCSRTYRWQEKLAGKKVRCKCGQPMLMPAAPPSMEDDIFAIKDEIPVKAAGASSSASSSKASAASAVATAASHTGYCPSCENAVNPGAVICMGCGFNLKENKQLKTQTGGKVRASTGPVDGPRHSYIEGPDSFGTKFSRSWELVKISYGIIWDFKQLIIFPICSAIASILVVLSFIYPVFMIHTASEAAYGVDAPGGGDPTMQNAINIAMGLVFYFCTYFVIVFFNTALTACAMRITAGEAPTVRDGLSIAIKRIPQIAAWAAVSAVVGQLIKLLESQKTIGKIMAVVLGTGWSIITYFVVPVLCVEGVGPFKAIKSSFLVIRETWGESLLGNTAVGVINFLLALPIIGVFVCGFLMLDGNATVGVALMILAGLAFLIFCAAASAADGVLRALLYNYATGRELPADVDEDVIGAAFANKPIIS